MRLLLLSQCALSAYTFSDLFQVMNTIAMTNSWLVADSPIAEPVRLEGPDDFNQPSYVSILEFGDFEKVDSFDASVFAVPPSCHNKTTTPSAARRSSDGFRSPAVVFNNFARLRR